MTKKPKVRAAPRAGTMTKKPKVRAAPRAGTMTKKPKVRAAPRAGTMTKKPKVRAAPRAGTMTKKPKVRAAPRAGTMTKKPKVRAAPRAGTMTKKPKVRAAPRAGTMTKKPKVRAAPRAVPRHTVKITKTGAESFKREIQQYLDPTGYLSWSSREKKYMILGTNFPKKGLVQCPECGLGELMVIRSRTTGKRFMGCSNFYGGCKASSPLLQKAKLRATKSRCDVCRWPVIIFRYTRIQSWTRQCSNIVCSSRT